MESLDLELWQVEKLQYLGRLRARMEKVGFLPDDPLFQRVNTAHDAIHDLRVHLHYLSCDLRRLKSTRTDRR